MRKASKNKKGQGIKYLVATVLTAALFGCIFGIRRFRRDYAAKRLLELCGGDLWGTPTGGASLTKESATGAPQYKQGDNSTIFQLLT